MVKVPEYQQNVSLRPALRQDIDVRANAEHFGAAIGRGMMGLARGVGEVAQAVEAVQTLEDELRTKDAMNQLAEWDRQAKYGENGYLTLEGRNAVDAQKGYEEAFERKRKELGAKLPPRAARMYDEASLAHQRASFDQAIRHAATQRKQWFNDATTHSLNTYAEDAVAAYNNPAEVNRLIAAGQMEIRKQAQMLGWDDAVRSNRERQFVSDVRYSAALRLANDDPMSAQRYYEEHKNQFTGEHQAKIEAQLKLPVLQEKVKQNAANFYSMTREVDDTPEVTRVGPDFRGTGIEGVENASDAKAAQPDGAVKARKIGAAGPTWARAFLQARSNKDPSHVDNLDETFAQNLAAMIQDAPPEIRKGLGIYSGFRSVERQAGIISENMGKYGFSASDRARWNADVAAMGPVRAGEKWAARFSSSGLRKNIALPGRSNHQHGQAVDLSWNGLSLKHAPKNVVDWVHGNAAKYGLWFPLSNENWHIEPAGTRGTRRTGVVNGVEAASSVERTTVVPAAGMISPRVQMPSYDQMERYLSSISDPQERELTRKAILGDMDTRLKMFEQQQKVARIEAFNMIETQNVSPFSLPPEITTQIGMEGMQQLFSYWERKQAGERVDTDPELLYALRKYAATDPENFAKEDLTMLFGQLSKEHRDEFMKAQTEFMSDPDKYKAKALNLNAAFDQARTALEAVGLTTAGKKESQREDVARRLAQFQNALAMEMQAFQEQNNGKTPTQIEVQQMINRLLLPVVLRRDRFALSPMNVWSSTYEEGGMFLFESGNAPEDAEVDVAIDYDKIPLQERVELERAYQAQHGEAPTREQVELLYSQYIRQSYGLDNK